jgi:hypothetical protein
MTDVRFIVENTLVPHFAFNNVTYRIEQCYKYSDGASEPICLAVVGESRTGKSRALEECCVNHPTRREAAGLIVPILRVKTPSKPTVKGLAELMLRSMGDPKFDVGTENAKTARLQILMKNAGVRMVMIDEFQHFYDKASHKVMHHVADWLKILVDDSKMALVVAGLPSCNAVLEQNEQLAGRFLSPVVMPRFDWRNDDHREEFTGILGAFQESLGSVFRIPALDSPEMAFRCFCGTGGLVGYLTKFLRQAVWNALDAGNKTISLEHLAIAHKESVWRRDGLIDIESPFARDFSTLPSEALLERVLHIGIPKEDVSVQRNARAYKRTTASVSQLLSAR